MQPNSTTRTLAVGHKSPIESGYTVATGHDGADDYIRAMMQEAEEVGGSVDWSQVDELYADALAVDECQSEYTDWRS